MNKLQIHRMENVLQLLPIKTINYFSFTIFEKQQPVITYCNNQKWVNYCKNYYNNNILCLIKKYILSSKLNVINWNLLTLEKPTKEYINKRNKITGIRASISLLHHKNSRLIVVTFGTNQNSRYLINFFNHKIDCVSLIMKNLINKQV